MPFLMGKGGRPRPQTRSKAPLGGVVYGSAVYDRRNPLSVTSLRTGATSPVGRGLDGRLRTTGVSATTFSTSS